VVSSPHLSSAKNSCGLLPHAVETDQTAHGTRKTNNTVVQVEEAETAGGNGQIAQVGDELQLGHALVPVIAIISGLPRLNGTLKRNNILGQLLHLHRFLRIGTILLFLLRQPQVVQRIQTRNNIASQSDAPRPVGSLLQARGGREFLDARNIRVGHVVEQHVESVAELATYGQVLDDGVGGVGVGGDGGEFEVLDELCQAHGLAHATEVLLDAIEDVDGGLRVVGAVEVPGEEAREVLDCAEGLVAADCSFVRSGRV
jgi:hypothetical protein